MIGSRKNRAHQWDERRRQDRRLLHEQLLKQSWDLREVHEKKSQWNGRIDKVSELFLPTLTREENLSKFEILSLNSQATFRISRMKWIVWTIQEIFMMFSTQWTFPRYKSNNVFHTFIQSCGNANAEPPQRTVKHLGRAWYIGKRFCRSSCVFRSILSAGIGPHGVQKCQSRFTHQSGEECKPNTSSGIRDACQDGEPKFQSSSVEETFQRIMERTNNDCRFQIFISTNSPRQQRFACWKINFKTERGIQMPNFEVLDVRIASALNRIIHNSHFKRRISLEEQEAQKAGPFSFAEDRLLTWSMSTSGSQEPMIPSRTMPTYSLLVFEMMKFRNSIQSGTDFAH